jgi:hypothetical protein
MNKVYGLQGLLGLKCKLSDFRDMSEVVYKDMKKPCQHRFCRQLQGFFNDPDGIRTRVLSMKS